MEIRSLRIDEIKADFEVYAYRDDLDGETVKRYQQIIDDLPPVDVFNTEEGLILAGEYHRLEAHRQEGRETITANIHLGTVVEAKMFACKANAQHGLNMTASERKRSRRDFIKFNLERDPLMSNYDIARSYGGCNASTIQRDRKALEADGEIESTAQRKGADGRIINTSPIGESTSANALVTFSLGTWDQLTEDQQDDHCSNYPSSGRLFNTQDNDSIEWARWSWNPITGCKHDCDYCYARDIANRFYNYLPTGKEFEPFFYPQRLAAPKNTKVPDLSRETCPVRRMGLQNVFVCSMADLFGKWVPEKWINAVLNVIRENPQWNYLMLTKFPIRMSEFEYPNNVWLGTTVDSQGMVERAEKGFQRLRDSGFSGVTWLSCEPMLESLTFEHLDLFDWLVVGGQSKATKVKGFHPERGWIDHLLKQARASDVPIFMKTNLGIDDHLRIREYPTSAMALPPVPIANGGDVISINGQVVTNMAEAEQAIKRIKYVGAEWAKLKSMILKMNIHADTFVQKFPTDDVADHLIDQDRDQAELIRTRLVPALDNTSRIISDLAERLTTYGQESFDLATADLLDTDKPGQLLMDGLLGEGVVQDGEAESR